MNTYEWMTATDSGNEPPLHEDDTREDPGHRPQVPVEDTDTTREHHGNPTKQDDAPEPFRSIEDPAEQLTASTEGLVDSVRKFFKMHNRGIGYMEVDGNAKANGYIVAEQLKKTYADKSWLDKQSHRPGKVKVGDLAKFVNFDKITQSVTETAAINIQFQNAQIQAILVNAKLLSPVFSKMDPRKLTDNYYTQLKAIVTEMKPITENIKLPSRSRTNLIDGKVTEDVREAMPLEDVQPTAEALVKALDESHSTWTDGAEAVGKLLPAHIDTEFFVEEKGAHSPSYNNEAWSDLMKQLNRKLFGPGAPEVIAAYRQFEATTIAVVAYMERSFTGGKVEVSNEGIFDAIKGLFAKKPEIMEIKWVDHEIGPEFDKTLFNQQWLDKQTFTEGEVSIKFPKAAINGAYDPLSKEILAELSKVGAQNAKLGKAYYGKTKPAYDAMNINIGDRSIAEIQKLRDLVNYEDMDFVVKWVEPKTLTEPEVTMELPALDSAGVQKAAKMIITLVTALQAYNREAISGVPKYPKPAWRVLVTHLKDESKIPLIREYHEDLESIADYGVESFFQRTGVQWDVVENLTYGLMRWIAKSVTGISFEK